MATRAQKHLREEERCKVSEKKERNDFPKEARILETVKMWFLKLQIRISL